jgi:Sec-independent protein secretion pathway component TatC
LAVPVWLLFELGLLLSGWFNTVTRPAEGDAEAS